MEVKLSTKKILLSIIDECDFILREFLSILTSNEENTNPIKLLDLLLDKDAELKSLIPKVNEQIKMQRIMDYLKSEIEKRDKMILSCQLHLRKSEIILNTAIFYSRKKLGVISSAVANPVDPEEIIRYGHKITAGHGVVAPNDWIAGDKRRPFPTEENIRNGYLGHVDNVSGEWVPNFVEYVAANQEARLSAIFGLTQPPPSPQQQSPRVAPALPPVTRPNPMSDPTVSASAAAVSVDLHMSAGGSSTALSQLPPGVNVVTSPASNFNRSTPMVTIGAGTPTEHRNTPLMAAARVSHQHNQQSHDDVEMMTDSCSSSSSDGF